MSSSKSAPASTWASSRNACAPHASISRAIWRATHVSWPLWLTNTSRRSGRPSGLTVRFYSRQRRGSGAAAQGAHRPPSAAMNGIDSSQFSRGTIAANGGRTTQPGGDRDGSYDVGRVSRLRSMIRPARLASADSKMFFARSTAGTPTLPTEAKCVPGCLLRKRRSEELECADPANRTC